MSIYIGVGGWMFDEWRGNFYPPDLPQKRELEYASRQLTAIEINSTYYGSQKPESFARWHDETPGDFVFTLKGPRFATNRRVLAESGPSVEKFLASGVTLMAFGQELEEASKSAMSNFLVAMNCQLSGPSFIFSRVMPLSRNFSTEGPDSASTQRLVAKRGPFKVKTKSSGVSSCQRAKLSGFRGVVIGAVDLDGGELMAGIFQLALLAKALGIEVPPPFVEHPAADTDIDAHGKAFA